MISKVEQPPPPPSDSMVDSTPSFDLSKKKKKKKPKAPIDALNSDESVNAVTSALASASLEENGGELGSSDVTQDQQAQQTQQAASAQDFALPTFGSKKKKKKKKKVDFGDDGAGGGIDGDAPELGGTGDDDMKKNERQTEPQPWDNTDRDYTYAELINRAFQFLHGKNPALAAGASQRKHVRLELPQVAREGTKKTVFLNFGSICKSIHRQQDHFLAYLCAELGTTGNIQEGGRLVIKGRFGPEGIANVLKRYMREYVMCMSCRSPDTVLMRDANTRLYFVSCESCGAKRSVAPIRQGFMAQVEKRKK